MIESQGGERARDGVFIVCDGASSTRGQQGEPWKRGQTIDSVMAFYAQWRQGGLGIFFADAGLQGVLTVQVNTTGAPFIPAAGAVVLRG